MCFIVRAFCLCQHFDDTPNILSISQFPLTITLAEVVTILKPEPKDSYAFIAASLIAEYTQFPVANTLGTMDMYLSVHASKFPDI